MKIGIIGQGFVGTAVKEGLKNFFEIETYDLNKKCTCKSLKDISGKSEVIFLCLPTPMKKDGEAHLGIVNGVLSELNDLDMCKTVILKSTVPPTSTSSWNYLYNNIEIIFSPEFLTEANSIDDFKNQNRIILGGNPRTVTKVKRIFTKAFPKVPVIKTDSTTAEMVKYLTNTFLATKVSFANEIYSVCQKINVDFDKVTEYARYDDRLGYSHWNVPGPDGKVGFSGSCFPKDILAFIRFAEDLGMDLNTLQGAWETNTEVRPGRDWEDLKGRAVI